MKLNANIKSFGKIQNANLRIAPFTVIGGPNASGKSYVSRALYSFFSTINQDYITESSATSLRVIKRLLDSSLSKVSQKPSSKVLEQHHRITDIVHELERTLSEQFGDCTFTEQKSRLILLEEIAVHLDRRISNLRREIGHLKKYSKFDERLALIQKNVKDLLEAIKNPIEVLANYIERGFTEALKENFQAANLSDLRNYNAPEEKATFDFGEFGRISINGESIEFQLTTDSVNQFQALYNVVFIESPIYWKLRKPLQQAKEKYRFLWGNGRDKGDSLNGVPKYFYDLINLVEKNIKSPLTEPSIVELQSKLKFILKGELDIGESGDITYRDAGSGQSLNLNLTASGVTNLGIIGLLLKRNVIAKGSFIFIDEPEVNLHPAWQRVMVETLYKLSQCGVNIVITTHSIDMMKYVENIMEENDDGEVLNHFAINRLLSNGISIDDDIHPLQAVAKIKEDLGQPFYDLTLESWGKNS